jgi:hypothetical protein
MVLYPPDYHKKIFFKPNTQFSNETTYSSVDIQKLQTFVWNYSKLRIFRNFAETDPDTFFYP